MPRTPLQFQQMKDERKLSILEASLPLFSLDRNKVSVDKICAAAKCSHGLVYHYFKDTDAVFAELRKCLTYKEVLEGLNIKTNDKYAIESIRYFVEYFVGIAKSKNFAKIAFANIVISDEGKDSFEEKLFALVERGQKEGDVTGGDKKDISYCFINLMKGIYLQFLTQKHPKVYIPSVDNIIQLFMKKSALRRTD